MGKKLFERFAERFAMSERAEPTMKVKFVAGGGGGGGRGGRGAATGFDSGGDRAIDYIRLAIGELERAKRAGAYDDAVFTLKTAINEIRDANSFGESRR
jgi:hypothetical protein